MQRKKAYLIDTNVILRFLLNDIPEQSERARRFLESVEVGVERVYLTDLVFSECIWVLEKFYKIPRAEIRKVMRPIILFEGMETQSPKTLLLDALSLWEKGKADWTDAFLATYCKQDRREIISFDKDFEKL